jgi:uncharacterized repeat protein (TIGR04138 family)
VSLRPSPSADALLLVFEAGFELRRLSPRITPALMCGALARFAAREFGQFAGGVLRNRGIGTMGGVGDCVRVLAEEGHFTQDTAEDLAAYERDYDVAGLADRLFDRDAEREHATAGTEA